VKRKEPCPARKTTAPLVRTFPSRLTSTGTFAVWLTGYLDFQNERLTRLRLWRHAELADAVIRRCCLRSESIVQRHTLRAQTLGQSGQWFSAKAIRERENRVQARFCGMSESACCTARPVRVASALPE
jgi:hypothetical protein